MPYDAFISYGRAADERIAPLLRDGLQQLARPWNKRRALSVFLDRASLEASSGLRSSLQKDLDDAEYFVLLASPSSAASTWVAEEIGHWISSRGSPERLQLALTEGEIVWDEAAGDFDWQRSSAVPDALRGVFTEEPLFVDLRWARSEADLDIRANPRFRDVVAALAAPMHGVSKDELVGVDLERYRRSRRLRRAAIAALAALTIISVGAGLVANEQRRLAEERARVATSRALAAAAVNLMDVRHPLALLLAVESVNAADTTEAQDGLLNVLPLKRRLERYLAGPDAAVTDVVVGAASVAATSADGDLHLWEPVTGTSAVLAADGRPLTALAMTPDGTEVVVADEDGVVLRLDRAIGEPGAEIAVPGTGHTLSEDGALVAAAGDDGGIVVADTRTGRTLASGSTVTGFPATNLTLGPAADRLLYHDYGDVVIASVAEGLVPDATLTPEAASGFGGAALAWRPDGGGVASAAHNGGLTYWDLEEGFERSLTTGFVDDRGTLAPSSATVSALAFSPDGAVLAAGNDRGQIVVWDLRLEVPLEAIEVGAATVTTLGFDADGTTLLSGSADGTVGVWRVGGFDAPTTRTSLGRGIAARQVVDLSANGRWAIGDDGKVWRLQSDEPVTLGGVSCDSVELPPFNLFAAAVSDGGAAACIADGVAMWPADARDRPRIVDRNVQSVSFVDAATLAVVSFDEDGSVLELRDVDTGEALRERWPDGLDLGVTRPPVVFARSGGSLAVATFEAGYPIRVASSSGDVRDLPSDRGRIPASVAFAPDGTLAVGYQTGEIVLWNAETGDRGAVLTGHGTRVTALAFHPDGSTLASGDGDGRVLLWRVETGLPRGRPIRAHEGPVADLAFTDDPEPALVSAGPTEVITWDLGTDAWVKRACDLAGRNLTQAEWDVFLGAAVSYRATCDGSGP